MKTEELAPHLRLAQRITQLRDERGWSKQRLADETERLGKRLSRAYISKLELGLLKCPSADKLSVLADALGVPLRNLLEVTGLVQPVDPVLDPASIRNAIDRALGGQAILSEQAIQRIVREIQRQEIKRAND